jgi:hypothetical protein
VLRKAMLRSRSGHVRSDITCKEDHVDKLIAAMVSASAFISVIQESLSEGSLKIDVVNIQSLQSLCQQVLVTCVI